MGDAGELGSWLPGCIVAGFVGDIATGSPLWQALIAAEQPGRAITQHFIWIIRYSVRPTAGNQRAVT